MFERVDDLLHPKEGKEIRGKPQAREIKVVQDYLLRGGYKTENKKQMGQRELGRTCGRGTFTLKGRCKGKKRG